MSIYDNMTASGLQYVSQQQMGGLYNQQQSYTEEIKRLQNLIQDSKILSSDRMFKPKEEKKMFSIYSSFKTFVTKHSDVIFTVVLVLVLDKFVFGGALKNSLQGLADKLLSKAHKIIDKE